ncbi:unnamed protein product [Coregonus sp. 'balchen']|nr:unnamed protein product [Coregonus sp. 'balchen']
MPLKTTDALGTYSSISGYKVNMDKTSVTGPFRWLPQGFKYLGITVDNDLRNVYKLNYPVLVQKVVDDLNRWIDMPLTLFGRINCFKINVLPMMMYPFQS